MSCGHCWWCTNVPRKRILEGSITDNVVIQNCMLMTEEGTPPFNILITNILFRALNIFCFSSTHQIQYNVYSSFEPLGAKVLSSSCGICSVPCISAFEKWSKNLQPSCDSHCELVEYCLAYNNVVFWLIEQVCFMRKAWLKIILLRGAEPNIEPHHHPCKSV